MRPAIHVVARQICLEALAEITLAQEKTLLNSESFVHHEGLNRRDEIDRLAKHLFVQPSIPDVVSGHLRVQSCEGDGITSLGAAPPEVDSPYRGSGAGNRTF